MQATMRFAMIRHELHVWHAAVQGMTTISACACSYPGQAVCVMRSRLDSMLKHVHDSPCEYVKQENRMPYSSTCQWDLGSDGLRC